MGAVLFSPAVESGAVLEFEDGALMGGFGSGVLEALADWQIHFKKVLRFGVPDRFITFGSRQQLMAECKLDSESIVESVTESFGTARESREAEVSAPSRMSKERLDLRV